MSIDNKISFLVFGRTGSAPKQITFSRVFLNMGIFALIVGAGVSAYFLFDYFQLREHVSARRVLERQVHLQQDELHSQRRQIQRFAGEIDSLKTKIHDLIALENQVRIKAELEGGEAPKDGFGLGGPSPQDMESPLALSKSHDELMRRLSDDIDYLDNEANTRGERLKNLIRLLEEKLELKAHTPSILPVNGSVTSRYGMRRSPFGSRRSEMHSGLDLGAPHGTPILATADGVVKFSGRKGPMGLLLVLSHGYGFETYYGHCSKLLLKKGAKVNRGDKIALIGSTGRSTGSHVHYEVRLNGTPVNPNEYVLKN